MMYSKFSPKQIRSMLWWADRQHDYDAVICDGSVRSGKTISMTIGFVMWSCKNFNSESFAFCGKTIDSLKRNVIMPMQKWLEGNAKIRINQSKNYAEITMNGHTNRYYFFGGRDESSYQLIQGMTLAGVLFDEVALMPRSFVEQALARCSVSGSKFWFNCNPESPYHWFYREWICKHGEKHSLHLHFTMDDNYSLSSAVKERYERMYSGVFYDRYIKGLWVLADGLVYPMFRKSVHVHEIPEKLPSGEYYISVDYGTLNPTSMGLWYLTSDGHAYRIRESYYDARKQGFSRTDEEHYRELVRLAGNLKERIEYVIVDPSAASFIECIRRHQDFAAIKAKNDVLDGIRNTGTLLKAQRLHFSPECKDTIREFGLYCWDEKAKEDKVIKENDHAMDDMRYFVHTIMRHNVPDFLEIKEAGE
ncbi:MAG: PBSX family phage terminase large subunit [Oscillospiraceae bacterium]|nr:PBSX family phage terminase large subunit [Oscillospiraceae bacterium]